MRMIIRLLTLLCFMPLALAWAETPKSGGTLRIYQRDNPASASVHEEATYSTTIPFMSVFNNLVLYDQHIPRNSEETIRPELATAWRWSDDGLRLTLTLRDGVTWHDGKPFSSADVVCTVALLQEPYRSSAPTWRC